MLPHYHFGIAAVVIFLVSIVLFPSMPNSLLAKWILVGGSIAMLIDLDVTAIVNIKSLKDRRLVKFRDPTLAFKDFNYFMSAMAETGVIKIAAFTHVIFSAVAITLTYFFLPNYIIPVSLSVVAHLLADIPYLNKY